jgi:NTE family protein
MNFGLVLSGGGARGISHLGALQALDELGMRPAAISGTSAGAIVGALYAAGHPPRDILQFLTQTNFLKIFSLSAKFTGLLRMEATEKAYRQFLAEDSFEHLRIPLHVCATDLEKGEPAYFSQGELIRPLQASSCIPLLFAPVSIEGRYYVDGGILNNLPVEPLLGQHDFLVGVHSNAVTDLKVSSLREVMERTFLLAINANIETRKKSCHLFLEPPKMAAFKVFDVAKAHEIFEVGYEYALATLRQWQPALVAG